MLQEMMYAQPARLPDLANLVANESIVQLSNNQVFFVGDTKEVTGKGNRMYRVDLHGPKENEFIISTAFYYDGSMLTSTTNLLGLENSPSIVKIIKAVRFENLSQVKPGDQLVLRDGTVVKYSRKVAYAPYDLNTGRFHVHKINPDYYRDYDDGDEDNEPETLLMGLYDVAGNCISNENAKLEETFFNDIVGIIKK